MLTYNDQIPETTRRNQQLFHIHVLLHRKMTGVCRTAYDNADVWK